MRKCADFQDLLSLYIDSCLDDSERAELEEHLKSCPECREELQALQETVLMFNSLEEEELIPPASFRRELRQKLEKDQKAGKVTFMDKVINYVNQKPLRVWMPLAAAALLLFIIVPVAMNFGQLGRGSKSAPQEAQVEMYSGAAEENGALRGKVSFNRDEADNAAPDMNMTMKARGETAPQAPQMDLKAEQDLTLVEQSAETERKIIKTGQLNLEVDSYKDAAGQVNHLVDEMSGYMVSENTYVYDQQRKLLMGDIAIRIPNERFAEAISRLESLGNINNRSVNSQDVTEEYVDVESRLKAMRLKEERLLAILDQSGTLGDVLAVENELANTRADLEALEGRLRYLNNRTELSTINMTIRETLTPVKQIKTTGFQGVITRTREAFVKSINSVIIGIGNLVVYTGAYLPFIFVGLLVLVVLWLVLGMILKKYRQNK
ncbi:MAG: DUF4349 domain-containing protein [Peptococcaceae bacterium]